MDSKPPAKKSLTSKPTRWPKAFLREAIELATTSGTTTITCPDRQTANKLRFALYRYRGDAPLEFSITVNPPSVQITKITYPALSLEQTKLDL